MTSGIKSIWLRCREMNPRRIQWCRNSFDDVKYIGIYCVCISSVSKEITIGFYKVFEPDIDLCVSDVHDYRIFHLLNMVFSVMKSTISASKFGKRK